jgi:hypothetical protein
MSRQDLCVRAAAVIPTTNPATDPVNAPFFMLLCVPRAISILKMRRVGMMAVSVESPSARNVSVSDVAETTLPIAYRAPRNASRSPRSGERILTREPAAIGHSEAGASCAANGVDATNAAIQTSRMKRNLSSVLRLPPDTDGRADPTSGWTILHLGVTFYQEDPASSRVNPLSIFKP